jgi:eukaryotic-like serine/threonine-protein kinase
MQPLSATDRGYFPFWSPDSHSIGFFADEVLKTVPISGGPAAVLCPAPNPRGGTWSRDGTIIYSPEFMAPFLRVSARGGNCSTFMPALAQIEPPRWPDMLPDGRRFLFHSSGAVYLGSLDSNDFRKVMDDPSSALYRDDHLLFVRGGTLMAQRFDPDSVTLTPIAERVLYRLLSRPIVSASSTGLLAYMAGSAAEPPSWLSLTGTVAPCRF